MKKNFITKEYAKINEHGTMSMYENRNFMASKILEIEDNININDLILEWFESFDGTQGIGVDSVNKQYIPLDIKKKYIKYNVLENQSAESKSIYTKWNFAINTQSILVEYIYAKLRVNKIFARIKNINTLTNSVENAIKEYVITNVIPRIRFYNIVLYVKYYRLGDFINNEQIALQYDTILTNNVISDINKVTNFQVDVFANDIANIIYKQTQSSENYKFDFYFDVIYKKI